MKTSFLMETFTYFSETAKGSTFAAKNVKLVIYLCMIFAIEKKVSF